MGLEVFDARFEPDGGILLAPGLEALSQRRILLLSNGKLRREYGPYGEIETALAPLVERVTGRDLGVDEIDLLKGDSESLGGIATAISAAAEGVVLALCDWGVTQPSVMLAALLEEAGVPTVLVATEGGAPFAHAMVAAFAPGIFVAVLASPRWASSERVRSEVTALGPRILESLRRRDPPTASRTASSQRQRVLHLDGEDPAGHFVELMSASGHSDGLPLVPPIAAKVEAFLRAGGREPDERIWAPVPPRRCAVTAAEVAAVAVMAGCTTTVAPVVFAAYEAMSRPEFRLFQGAITSHPAGTLVMVSGTDSSRYGIHSSRGCLGPGFPGNASVGRAVALSYPVLLSARPGYSDQTVQGSPAEYSYCCAENLGASPWAGLHQELGFGDDTTVTVVKCEGPHLAVDHKSTSPEALLGTIASVLATLGGNNAYIPLAQSVVFLNPEHARLIADHRWSKRDAQAYLFEVAVNARKDLERRGTSPLWPDTFDGDCIPIASHPSDILVVVAGGPGPNSQVAIPWGYSRGVTIAIR